jgi:uncharacterized protein
LKAYLTLTGRIIAALAIMVLIQQIALMSGLTGQAQLYFPALAIATFVMLLLFRQDHISFGDRRVGLWKSHGLGWLTGFALISLCFALLWLVQAIEVTGISFNSTILTSLISTTVLFFIVAFQEEYFFRGYLYSLAENLFNRKAALITSSLLFTALHALNPGALANPLPLCNIALAGLLLGLMRIYSDDLWLPIGFHWAWNLFQGTIYGSSVSGVAIDSVIHLTPAEPAWLSGGNFGAEGSILTSIVLLASIVLFYRLCKKRT